MILYTTFENTIPEHSFYWIIKKTIDHKIRHGDEGNNWEEKKRDPVVEYTLFGVHKPKVDELEEISRLTNMPSKADRKQILSNPNFYQGWDIISTAWRLDLLVPFIEEAETKWKDITQRRNERKALDAITSGGIIKADYSDLAKHEPKMERVGK